MSERARCLCGSFWLSAERPAIFDPETRADGVPMWHTPNLCGIEDWGHLPPGAPTVGACAFGVARVFDFPAGSAQRSVQEAHRARPEDRRLP